MAIKAQPLSVSITALIAATGLRKTGDAANINPFLIKDGAFAARNDTTAVTETSSTACPGEYVVVLNATDMGANAITLSGFSSTSGVEIIPVKIVTEQGKFAAELTAINNSYASEMSSIASSYASLNTDTDAILVAFNTVNTGISNSYASLNTDTDAIIARMAPATTLASVFTDTTAMRVTLTTIMGAGFTNQSLVHLDGEIDRINDGGDLDNLIDAIKAKTDNLPSSPASQITSASIFTDTTTLRATVASQTSVNTGYASTALQISNSYASLIALVASATNLTTLQNSVNYSYASLIADHTVIKAQMAPATTLASVFTDTTTLRAVVATHTDTNDIDTAISAIPTTSSGMSTTQDANLSAILFDTSTTLDGLLRALPTTAGTLTMTTTDVTNIANAVVAGMTGGGDTLVTDIVTVGGVPVVGAKIGVFHTTADEHPFAVSYTDDTGYYHFMLDVGVYPALVEADNYVTQWITITVV
jgi:hypothetical protein